MFLSPKCWIFLVFLAGVLPPCCLGVNVFVRDERRYSVLFQSVVLPCQYTSVSTQTPVVQWVYKSYCRDRTRDSFSHYDNLGGGLGGGGGLTGATGGAGGGYETGMMGNYLDCSDNSRTVRTVASIAGSSITLSEYYKNRDISIINKADLRIGEVQWGDSGVYICKVVISDDLEGQNEASVELLVLEWVFVTAVVLGSVLFLLLLGVCWCQCCPHSCCCYVSCWCCPDTCCCPRHLYEAGKGIKTGTTTPQTPAYPPYFVSGVPTMVPIAPPSLVDKMSSVPPSDGSILTAVPMHAVGVPYRVPSSQDQNSLRVLQYVEKQLAHFNPARSSNHQSCSLSELSSLHDGEPGFRQTYRNIQLKALPTIPDHNPQPEPQRYRENRSPEPQHYHNKVPSPQRHRDEHSSEPRRCQEEPPDSPLRRYSNDPPSSSQSRRLGRDQQKQNHIKEDNHNRWNPRSEHLQRKTYRTAGRSGSLEELEEFASCYKQRGGRGAGKEEEEHGDYEREFLEYSRYPSYRNGPSQHYYNDENGLDDNGDHEDHPRQSKKNERNISPLSSPQKRKGIRDSDHPAPPPLRVHPPSTSSQEKDYDGTFLNSLLDRKSKLRGVGQGKSGSRGEEDSDTPSKSSSKKSSGESSRHCSRSPSNRPEVDSLSPYPDTARSRTDRPTPRPLPANLCLSQPHAFSQTNGREETRDKSVKVNTLLSRDSLIV
ncbi:immunoglobulin-like domain-containing receptor 2 isoform X1 [Solea senegalensis]|uniref:immunoglobulin-like domain-containing receptor 2 isoform X2 n=1 Tax=Solea senegalensis TaxID=28829 RepID=UPI001C41BAD6|nr:immunoglobulin-like domain-containing receptor 2 isoform X2 [Solea senegalensis]KAG7481901.1 immunoglobulin-like domain-containing receptor 2 isoform X1 [Solea senegalensis]